jgi:repressor LexA
LEEPLTKRQVEVLRLVRDSRARSGYSPTIREISDALGVSSVATAAEHLDSLESKGLISRRRDRARSVTLTARGRSAISGTAEAPLAAGEPLMVPLLGTIAAGEPVEALPVAEELEVPVSMAAGRRCYALRVRGSSMVDEGIFDGDYVVVEEKQVPENGEVVVALVNGTDATLKKFYREKKGRAERIRLQPANPDMEPIIIGPEDTIEVQGRVRGVLRLL